MAAHKFAVSWVVFFLGWNLTEAWYIGCHSDDASNRVFNIIAGNFKIPDTSPEECTSACALLNATYACTQGVPQGMMCFCSNSLVGAVKVDDSKCGEICAQKVCPGIRFLRVYGTSNAIAGLSVTGPDTGFVFSPATFQSTVAKGDLNTSYIYNYGDGSFVLSTCQSSSHRYRRTGLFNINVAARNNQSGPIYGGKKVTVKAPLGQSNALCPSHIVAAGNRTNISLYVAQGTNLSGSWVATSGEKINFGMNDALLYGVGSKATFGNISGSPQTSGVYVIPTATIEQEGFLVAWEFNAAKLGGIRFQVFRPRCLTIQKYCHQTRSCIPRSDNCGIPHQFTCPGDGKLCAGTGHCLTGCLAQNVTYPNSAVPLVNYTLVVDTIMNVSTLGHQLVSLSHGKEQAVQPGDVIGWTTNGQGDLAFEPTTSDPEFFYSTPGINAGDLLSATAGQRYDIKHVLQAHVTRTSWATHDYVFNSAGVYEVTVIVNGEGNGSTPVSIERCYVSVQEMIKGLQITGPKCWTGAEGDVAYPVNKDLSLSAAVTQGSNVTYTWMGDISNVTTTSNPAVMRFNSVGLHQLTLYAFNNISAVFASITVSVLEEVGTVGLVWPSSEQMNQELEIGIPGNYSFMLTAGSNVSVTVQIQGRVVFSRVFTEANNSVFNLTHTFSNGGMQDILVTADNAIAGAGFSRAFKQRVKTNMGVITIATQPVKTSDGFIRISTMQPFELFISSTLEKAINYTIETSGVNTTVVTSTGKATWKHKYLEPLEGNITIIASADGESIRFYIPVEVEFCGPPAIYLPVANRRDSSHTVTRGDQVELKTRAVTSQNAGCEPGSLVYEWNIYDVLKVPEVKIAGLNIDVESPALVIPPLALREGNYSVNLTITFTATDNSVSRYTYKTYIDVQQSSLIARITGGSPRDVPYRADETDLTLDGSESIDPDEPKVKPNYQWECRRNNDNATNEIFLVPASPSRCGELNFTGLSGTRSTIGLPLKEFLEGASYVFRLKILKDARTAFTEQVIKIVPEASPEIVIKCLRNCKEKVNPQDRLILEASCKNCNGGTSELSAIWKLLDSDRGQDRLHGNKSITTTGFDKMELAITAGSLSESTVYYLQLRVTRRSLTVNVEYRVETTAPPTGGSCIAIPSTGTASKTEFTIDCDYWTTLDFPLNYEFHYITKRNEEAQINSLPQQSELSNLWYYGLFRKAPASVLPVGDADRDYMMPLVVEISNKYGAHSKFELNVTVIPVELSVTEVKEIKDQLASQTVDVKQDPQRALQLVASVVSVLSSQKASGSERLVENTKLRSQCIELATQTEPEGLPAIVQVANAVTVSMDNEDEVTSDTQLKASGFLSRISQKALEEAQKTGLEETSAKKVEETAQVIFSGVSNNLQASNKTTQDFMQLARENLNKTKDEMPSRNWAVRIRERNTDQSAADAQVVVDTLNKAINTLNVILQLSKVVSENKTTVRTKTFNVQLEKKTFMSVGSESIALKSGQFVLPSRSALIDGKKAGIGDEDKINIQAVNFNGNPMSWDSDISPFITGDVIGLEFRLADSNKEISVQNTLEDIEVVIPADQKSARKFTNTFENNKNRTHFYRIKSEVALNSPLLIYVEPSEPLTLFVRFGSKPTPNEYDLKVGLPNSDDALPERFQRVDNYTFLLMDLSSFKRSADLHLTLKAQAIQQSVQIPGSSAGSSVGVASQFEANYTIDVRSVACQYWREGDSEKWRSSGCKVSNKTSIKETHCLCNHLTFFGSFVVAPNPIGPLTAEDFKKGYALFIFVSGIFCVYFLGLIWARKKDRADLVKVGVCPLPDNDPSDTYRYEITLWTSMRRGAGTTSKVSMIMYGEENETEARVLDDPQRPPFQRGCVNTFLLTTPSILGPLPYIRIWHDNSGGSWFLSRVMVIDLQNDDRYYFICNRWLAVDEDDGQVERLVPLASREELTEFQHLFVARTRRNLSDSHLWFSVFARPANSRFTRVQRLSCCLCLMMMSMMTSAMFWGRIPEAQQGSANNFAGFLFTWQQVFVGIISSLIVFPVNLIVVQIFRSVRPKPHRVMHKKGPNPPRLSLTVQNLTSYNRMKDKSDDSNGSNNSIDSTHEKNARLRLSINDVHTDVDRVSFTSSPLLVDNRRRSTVWENDGSRFRRAIIWLKKHSSLPYYWVYVAWVLVFLLTTASAIVVILYGMQFKNVKSLSWLTSSIVSFIQDVLITQPLKVLLTAIFFALVVKKPDKGEFEIPNEAAQLAEDEEWLYSAANNNKNAGKKIKAKILPPDQAKLLTMRHARMRERKMYAVLRELGFFYIFLCLVLMIAYTHKDTVAFIQTNEFKDRFSNDFLNIQTDAGFWKWAKKDLLPNLFPSKWYNGKEIPHNGFLADHNSQMVGGARLRLIRVKTGTCAVPKDITFVTQDCFGEYSIGDDDENDYLPGWSNVTKYTKPVSRKDVSWRHQSGAQLDGYPVWANVSSYSGGGYVFVLEPGMDNMKNLKNLEEKLWLDRKSRVIITEFTTYNAQTNLFSIVTLAAEFPATGGVVPFVSIQTARLYNFTKDIMYFVLTLEGVFVLFILFFSYKELKLLVKQGWNHFKEFWNVVEFVINVSALIAIALYIYRMLTIKDVVTKSRNAPFQFMSFQLAGYWDEMYTFTLAILVMFTTIKLNKLLRFNKRMSLLSSTLKHAAFPLAMFGVLFGIIFLAFTLISTVVFGTAMQEYRSAPKSFTSLLSLMLGKASFLGMYEVNRILGPLVFFTFMFLVSMVLINMFLSIIIDSFHVVRRDLDKQSNEHEIVDFILDRFKLWAGIGKVKRPRRSERRVLWDVASSKIRAVTAFSNSLFSLNSNTFCPDQVSELENRLEKLVERTDLLYSELFPEKIHKHQSGKHMKTSKI
ncbi:polycystic kidney disease protein 1-like 2 [Nematostella vectensis]|uniref:polycystic kidney disease protein 1-like 2 n=1 Tax=Nematostella vectensis TaxID=45351 RepID=UPI00207740CE|nr:polycystic kidney disease protein 1-like 2 [Nematostella vectensis]XP_048575325.1 polycystic kidney disease protein 1-like 2 [Nematostella vectensis]